MSIQFSFVTDEKSKEFCNDILKVMVNEFFISEEEALGRINRIWKNSDDFVGLDIRYHELEEFWAYFIYYGNGSYFWNKDEGNEIKPIPYP